MTQETLDRIHLAFLSGLAGFWAGMGVAIVILR